MQINKYCFCEGCRFPYSHVTSYHRCGECNSYGHGQAECNVLTNTHIFINKLFEKHIMESTTSLPSELHCTIPTCLTKYTHSIGSHQTFFEQDKFGSVNGPDQYGIKKRICDSDEKGYEYVSKNINSEIVNYIGMGNYDVFKNVNGVISKERFS